MFEETPTRVTERNTKPGAGARACAVCVPLSAGRYWSLLGTGETPRHLAPCSSLVWSRVTLLQKVFCAAVSGWERNRATQRRRARARPRLHILVKVLVSFSLFFWLVSEADSRPLPNGTLLARWKDNMKTPGETGKFIIIWMYLFIYLYLFIYFPHFSVTSQSTPACACTVRDFTLVNRFVVRRLVRRARCVLNATRFQEQ